MNENRTYQGCLLGMAAGDAMGCVLDTLSWQEIQRSYGRRGLLGYDLKTAVGTSVFVMTFTALMGAVSHFAIDGIPDLTILALCVGFTFIWARIGARIANKSNAKTLNLVTGILLLTIGIVVMIVNFFF